MNGEQPKPLNLVISPDRAKRLFDQLLGENTSSDQARWNFINHSLNISNLLNALLMRLSQEDINRLLTLGENMAQQPNYQSYIFYVGANKKSCPVDHFDQAKFSAGMLAELENAREKLKVPSKKEEILLLGLRAVGAVPFKDRTQIESFYMEPIGIGV